MSNIVDLLLSGALIELNRFRFDHPARARVFQIELFLQIGSNLTRSLPLSRPLGFAHLCRPAAAGRLHSVNRAVGASEMDGQVCVGNR